MERMYASDGRHPTASGAYMAYTWQKLWQGGRGQLPAGAHSLMFAANRARRGARAAALGSAADEPASGARSEVVGAGAELRLLSIDLNITQPKGGFPFNSQPQAQHKTADHTVRLRYTACRSAAYPYDATALIPLLHP